MAELIPNAFCTTVFLAILDNKSGESLTVAPAICPRVLAAPQAAPTLITDARSVALAVNRKNPRPQESVVLPPGSRLMLYTNGLVERRDVSLDEGSRTSARRWRADSTSPRRPRHAALRELAPPGGDDDGIAIVVYRRPYAPRVIDQVDTADDLSDVRHQLAIMAAVRRSPQPQVADIVLSVIEACANSIENS